MTAPGTDTPTTFGGFSLGGLQLALPMAALREVTPCAALVDLPCPASCVIGGIGLRGVVVPVVDLRLVLGRDSPAGDCRNVVVMVHEGKILGLLVDSVTGIFEAVPGSLKRASVGGADAAVFFAGAMRSDSSELVSVLSTEALSKLPGVPMVEDPEPARQSAQAANCDHEAALDPSVPMMLLHCGDVPLAVEAMVVHATLSDPLVEPSALRGGHCRGAIAYGGMQIPALDLQSLCGLGSLDADRAMQAFVVALPEGHVAFLISSVIDVVRTLPADVKPIPAFALPRPGLFAGSLPLSALPADRVERIGGDDSQYLVISAAGLKACEEVVALSAMNVAGSKRAGAAKTAAVALGQRSAMRRPMITYLVETEQATPLEQVTEILAYRQGTERFASAGPLLGFMVDRGRSIPVLCLAQVTGARCAPPTAASSVLVVEAQGDLIGFAVPALKSIEQADWEPAVPEFKAGADGTLQRREGSSQQLAMVGSGETERMLVLLDLQRIARSFHDGALAGGQPGAIASSEASC